MKGYGIDFGTTSSLASYYDENGHIAVALRGPDGRPHPSVIWYSANESPVFGREAKLNINRLAEVAGNIFVSSIKRKLGRGTRLDIFGERKEAWQIAGDILSCLLQEARRPPSSQDIKEAIITIPVQADGKFRRDLRKAADRAGLAVKTFIHEPFAAVLSWICGDRDLTTLAREAGHTVLVFDWGGGTLDITIAQVVRDGIVELATRGLPDRSGDYFDNLLLNHVQSVFLDTERLRTEDALMTPSARDRFLFECERGKIALSDRTQVTIEVAQAYQVGRTMRNLSVVVSRAEFEREIGRTVDAALALVQEALSDAGLTPRQVDEVLLIGGTSLIPSVRERMHELFGYQLVAVPNADSIIAEGAAIAAALGLEPFLARTIAVSLSDGTHFPVFRQGHSASPRACRDSLSMFCTDGRDGRARLVLEESAQYGIDEQYHTKAVLPIPVSSNFDRRYGPERVDVEFVLDQDLVMHVAGKGATQLANASLEIRDLCFGLKLGGR